MELLHLIIYKVTKRIRPTLNTLEKDEEITHSEFVIIYTQSKGIEVNP